MSGFRNGARVAVMATLGLMGCIAGIASASQFSLNTTRVHLGAAHAVETVVLTNRESRPLAFEVRVLRWKQQADGEWVQTPSDGLVVHPLILKVAPSGDARLRVGSLSPSVTAEEAYRIELHELPDREANTSGQVRMLMNVSVPVFVEPEKSRPAVAMSVSKIGSARIDLQLRNGGNAYAPPASATLRVKDASGRVVHEAKLTTNYVLAGAQLPLHAELPSSACPRASVIELAVDDAAPLVAKVAPESRQCAH
jgi:fimbrial chaperone protein